MNFDWTEEDLLFRANLKQLVAETFSENWRGYDKTDVDSYKSQSAAFCKAMAKKGWLTQSWPKEFGGSDSSAWRAAILSEEMWPLGEPRGPQYMNVNWIGPAIMANGTDAQKDYHLNRISNGDVFWCQGFSEPDAGSDLASLKCRAVLDGEHYIVNGTKIWTSHVGLADFCFLLVRTDVDVRKHKGISILLVPMDTEGIEVSRIDGVVGEQAFHQLIFDDVKVHVSNRLGDENDGWAIVRNALQFERVGAALYEEALLILGDVVQVARENGKLEDPEIQSRIGEVYAACEAARMLVYRVVELRTQNSPPTADSNLSRVAQTNCLSLLMELSHLVFGAAALETGSPGNLRRLMAFSIAAGTAEIQLDQIATRYLDLPRKK